MSTMQQTDVLIIGAGPSGSSAAALLRQKGHQVTIIEKQYFPRFSIGESLLPQSMVFLEEAGLLDTVRQHVDEFGFQFKNGAAFLRGKQRSFYDFTEKFSDGPGTTWQVRRAHFDHLLAQQTVQYGAEIRFGHEVIDVDVESKQPILTVKDEQEQVYQIQAKFLLDASGFGRMLPKFLDLESPSDFPVRRAVFTHSGRGPGAGPPACGRTRHVRTGQRHRCPTHRGQPHAAVGHARQLPSRATRARPAHRRGAARAGPGCFGHRSAQSGGCHLTLFPHRPRRCFLPAITGTPLLHHIDNRR